MADDRIHKPRELNALQKKVQNILDAAGREGYLSEAELDRKRDLVLATEDPERLEGIVDSIPSSPASKEHRREQPSKMDSNLPALASSPRSYFTIMGSIRKNSPELLSNQLDTITVMGDARLDFSSLDWEGEILVNVTVVMGDVKITLPKQTDLDLAVTAIMADSGDRRKSPGNTESRRKIRVQGIAIMGDVKVMDR